MTSITANLPIRRVRKTPTGKEVEELTEELGDEKVIRFEFVEDEEAESQTPGGPEAPSSDDSPATETPNPDEENDDPDPKPS